MKQLLYGVGFSTAGEPGDVHNWNGFLGVGVEMAVQLDYFVLGSVTRAWVGGHVDEGENSVKPILHVGYEIFGVRNGRGVSVCILEREVVPIDLEGLEGPDQRGWWFE